MPARRYAAQPDVRDRPQANCLLHLRCQRIGMCQHEAGQPESKRRLANSGRPADQPGMWNPAAFVGIEQRALGVAMAKQCCRLARQLARSRSSLSSLVTARSSPRLRACSGCSRSCTIDQMRSATTSRGARPSMTMHRCGLLGGERAISLPKSSREIPSIPPRTGRRFLPAPAAWHAPVLFVRARRE